jgi:hypothetical protein
MAGHGQPEYESDKIDLWIQAHSPHTILVRNMGTLAVMVFTRLRGKDFPPN